MQVLFVCQRNILRSQIAAAFFNKFTSAYSAESAGLTVDKDGETLDEYNLRMPGHSLVLPVMHEVGFDLGLSERTQLTRSVLDQFDTIISMADLEDSPSWLLDKRGFIYWDIADPGSEGFDRTAETRDEIQARVLQLIATIMHDK